MSKNIKRPTIITIKGKTDGFGAQFQAIMSGFAFARYNNYVYRHTAFKSIAHYNYPFEMNTFCGFKSDKNDISSHKVDIVYKYIQPVHRSCVPDIYYTQNVLDEMRKLYMTTEKPPKCKYDVAIHIRRGDVNLSSEIRYTPNKLYLTVMNFIRKKYNNISFCIYSEGNEKDFELLKNHDVIFSLNTNIKNTFHEMVTAKILVMAKSSFSYCAALLSQGEILYIPFWHKPLKHWNIVR